MSRADDELRRISEEYSGEIDEDNADKLRRLETDEHSDESFDDYLRSIEEKQQRRQNNTPGDEDGDGDDDRGGGSGSGGGSSVVSSWNGGGGSGGGDSWYRSMIERQMGQSEEAAALNRQRGDQLYNTLMTRAGQSLNIQRPGTPGYVAPTEVVTPGTPGTTTSTGGLTKEQVLGIYRGPNMTTRGLLGDPGFERWRGVGGSTQGLLDYMNSFAGVDEQGNPRRPITLDMVPEELRNITPTVTTEGGTPAVTQAGADPNAHIWSQVDQYAAQQERARRNYLSDLAEKEGPRANIRGERRIASERMGQAVGGFESELIGSEIQARRAEIQSALSGALGMLSGDQQINLQRELSMLDQGIKEKQLGLQARGQDMDMDQYLRQLALQESFGWKDRDYRDIYGSL